MTRRISLAEGDRQTPDAQRALTAFAVAGSRHRIEGGGVAQDVLRSLPGSGAGGGGSEYSPLPAPCSLPVGLPIRRSQRKWEARPARKVSCAEYFSPNFRAGLLDQRRKGRVMDMADAGEEVVLDLEIQPADVPREQPIAAGEIDGRFDLVYGPARRHSARVWLRAEEKRRPPRNAPTERRR